MRKRLYERLEKQKSEQQKKEVQVPVVEDSPSLIEELEEILKGGDYDMKIHTLKSGEKVVILTQKEVKKDVIGHETL
jgi:hypothetical protein